MSANTENAGRIDRRTFLKGSALAAAATAAGGDAVRGFAAETAPKAAEKTSVPLISSAPILQNAAETSMGVAFGVSADASGWVDYSTSPDLADAVRAYSGSHGMMDVRDRVALVRLTGLRPATRYYYRVGADRISFKNGYDMRNLGSEADAAVHSFTTLGVAASGAFCVINDTHDRKETMGRVLSKVSELKPSVVIWNGDASNSSEDFATAAGIFLHPHADHPAYAANLPYIFLNGNHDYRGRFNRRLGEELMMFREPTERRSVHADLGRNFVQRLGDIALIGLDTGEDKLDTNPKFAGLFKMKPYRELQARWLAEAIETPTVKTAKFRVVFCHIPLFDANPKANPGDVAPADYDPKYAHDYARWQRTCATLWGPSLIKAGVHLVISAHQHRFRYDAPAPGRPWAQIVGGGPVVNSPDAGEFPTVIEGIATADGLLVTVHDVAHGTIAGTYSFS